MATTAAASQVAYLDPYWQLWDSFTLHLEAAGRSPLTIATYHRAVQVLREWLDADGQPSDPVQITKAHVEGFIRDCLRTGAQATASIRYQSLHSWFAWMEREEIIDRSPMHRMTAPKVKAQPTEILTADELGRLLKACVGSGFDDRRDSALFRLFVDTGLRRHEMSRLAVEDVDLRAGLLTARVKGGDTVIVPFGKLAARDLDRYLRERTRHRLAGRTVERQRDQGGREPELVHPLWLSTKGGLTDSGIYNIVKRRAIEAGLDPARVHPHTFRHSFAHSLKSAGASDEDVQRLGRWRDAKMVRRYGAALSQQRAWETHRRLSPGDRI